MNNLTFDDVLLAPQFSTVKSRSEVGLHTNVLGMKLTLPIISSNMDTVTTAPMAATMNINGGVGALHRFCSIQDNVKMFTDTIDSTVNNVRYTHQNVKPIVSLGVGSVELERALTLEGTGANVFLLDVAHGASTHVADTFCRLRNKLNDSSYVIVGNFANAKSIREFISYIESQRVRIPDALKIGIGGGGACLTRVVTGCGNPTFGSVVDCSSINIPLIADGGIRTSGDIAKSLGAGAALVMCGSMLAATDESPGEVVYESPKEGQKATHIQPHIWQGFDNALTVPYKTFGEIVPYTGQMVEGSKLVAYKKYRGSASLESYEVQGKVDKNRSPEGDSMLLPYKGSVATILEQVNGGLRSALSYVGARTLKEFKERCEFVQITQSGIKENGSHSKK